MTNPEGRMTIEFRNPRDESSSKMTRRGMSASGRLLFTDRLGHGPVQFQSSHGGASGWADSQQAHALPAEMKPPRISAGIEQRKLPTRVRVDGGLPRAFAKRTGDASESQIFEGCSSAGTDGNDVIGMERRLLCDLREATILTTVLRPLYDLTPQMRRDDHALMPAGDSAVGHAGGARRERRSGPPILRLRAFQPWSKPAPGPACRARPANAFGHLWAGGTSPDHPASRLRLGWLDAYAFSFLLAAAYTPANALSKFESSPASRNPASTL